MPEVVLTIGRAIAIGLMKVGIGAKAAIFIAQSTLYLGGTYILNAASMALQKKPDFSDFQSEAERRLNSTRGPAAARRVIYGEQRVSGHLVYVESHGNDNKYLNMIWALAGHECEAIDEIWLDDTVLTFSGSDGNATNTELQYPDPVYPLVLARKHLGTDAQTADSDLNGASSTWTSNHRLRGITYIYLRLHFEPERMNKIPNVTAVIRGKNDIYDFRDSSTGYSTNAALCIANYMMDSSLGLGIAQSEIDSTTIQASANVCDESVALNGGGTEDRYSLNGTFETSVTPKQILEKMLTSMAGTMADPGGTWYIHAGAYTAPTVTLNESHLRKGFQVQTKPSKSENFNAVRGIYANPDANYQPDDFPPVTNSTYATEDGETVWRDIELPYTTSAATAQRLAKIELERARQALRVVFPANMHGYQVQEGDTVAITLARMGWTSKVFFVEEAPLVIEPNGDGAIFGCDLLLKETASTVFSWSSGEETTVDPAPNTTLPDPGSVVPPTSLSVTSGTTELITHGDGSVLTRAKLSWTQPLIGFAQRIQIEYKKSADSTWIIDKQVPIEGTQAWISDVEDGVDYDFRVASVNGLGALSTYATETAHTIVGKTANPSDVTGLSVTPIEGGLKINWTHIEDPDFWYYSVEIDDNGSFTSPDENLMAADSHVELDLPNTLQHVRIRSFDTSGNFSNWSATVTGTPLEVFVPATGYIEPSGPTSWVQAKNSGAWTPVATTVDLDAAFDAEGTALCRIARRVTRDVSGNLTVASTTHKDGDLNTVDCTVTVSGSGTSSVSVLFEFDDGAGHVYSVSESVNTSMSGEDGLNVASVFLFQRNAGTPSVPSVTSTFTFSTGVLINHNNGWTQDAPANNGNPLWMTSAIASSATATDTILTGEWATPQKHAEDGVDGTNGTNGTNGTDGDDGLNNAAVILYKRTNSSSAPSGPNATATHTFATGVTTGQGNGWTTDPPLYTTGNHWLWVVTAAASSTGTTDTIGTGEWSTAQLLSVDGSRTATGLVYYTIAQAGTPATPSATSYNFTTGVFTGLTANWQESPVEVIISDTTTKYWTSRYTVEEDLGTGAQTITFQGATGSINFGSDIQSDNYVLNTSGWKLERLTGNLEANDGTFRGDLLAGTIQINSFFDVDSAGVTTIGDSADEHFKYDLDAAIPTLRAYKGANKVGQWSIQSTESYFETLDTVGYNQAALNGFGRVEVINDGSKSDRFFQGLLTTAGGATNVSEFKIYNDGEISWGVWNGSGFTHDTKLWRSAASVLRTDAEFNVENQLRLYTDANGGIFDLRDDSGLLMSRTYVAATGGRLNLYDDLGSNSVVLYAATNGGSLILRDNSLNTRIDHYVDATQGGVSRWYDTSSEVVLIAKAGVNGGHISVYNDAATPAEKIRLYTNPDGGRLVMWDSGGSIRIDIDAERGDGSATIAATEYRSYNSSDTDVTGLINGSAFGTLIQGRAAGHVVIGIRGNDSSDSFAIIKDEANFTGLGSYDTRLFEIDSRNAFFETEVKIENHSLWVYNGSSVNVAKVDTGGWFWSLDSSGYRAVMDPTNGFRVFNTSQVFQGGIDINGEAIFNELRLTTPTVPTSNTSAGTTGDISIDSAYLYVCTATNTWKRMALDLTSW
tara:strand:- start:1265 stop:6127 length:4863 start_codon:yes stop_codon:yes gene_type:complete